MLLIMPWYYERAIHQVTIDVTEAQRKTTGTLVEIYTKDATIN